MKQFVRSHLRPSKISVFAALCLAFLVIILHHYLRNRWIKHYAKLNTGNTKGNFRPSQKSDSGDNVIVSRIETLVKDDQEWINSVEPHQNEDVREQNKGAPENSPYTICPAMPPNLKGNLTVMVNNVSLEEVEATLTKTVHLGGSWWPTDCIPRWRVAFIVPMREREYQMGAFFNHLHPILQRQQINYTFFLVTQADDKMFNKGRMLNIAFTESLKDGPFDCFVFHDIDLLAENDRHLYHCAAMPRHLNVISSNYGYEEVYKLSYSKYYGGINMMTEKHFRMVNGWSNKYIGWGGEDDDMRRRIAIHGLHIWRYPKEIARYTALPHQKSVVNPNRYNTLYNNLGHHQEDGLSNLQYKLISRIRKPLFTEILAI